MNTAGLAAVSSKLQITLRWSVCFLLYCKVALYHIWHATEFVEDSLEASKIKILMSCNFVSTFINILNKFLIRHVRKDHRQGRLMLCIIDLSLKASLFNERLLNLLIKDLAIGIIAYCLLIIKGELFVYWYLLDAWVLDFPFVIPVISRFVLLRSLQGFIYILFLYRALAVGKLTENIQSRLSPSPLSVEQILRQFLILYYLLFCLCLNFEPNL